MTKPKKQLFPAPKMNHERPTDEELIKDFWISLRAEEIAREIADPENDMEGHWLAFEEAHIDADFEWTINYEGQKVDELDGPLIEDARKMLVRWCNDEKGSVQGMTLVDKDLPPRESAAQNTTGKLTAREANSLIKQMPSDHPFFSRGFVIGATRLRNSSPKKGSPKPSKKGEP